MLNASVNRARVETADPVVKAETVTAVIADPVATVATADLVAKRKKIDRDCKVTS